MGVITWNGKVSTDYGIHVETPPKYVAAEVEHETVHVPGRNGDLLFTKRLGNNYNVRSYKNVDREYQISMYNGRDKLPVLANRLSEFLHSTDGYARLEDDYEPLYFRTAMYTESIDVENLLFYGGKATIRFNCKPQRFLKSGETGVTFTSEGTISNPTQHTSYPILRVTGYGRFSFSEQVVEILEHPGSIPYIDIDIESGDAYYNPHPEIRWFSPTNCNQYVKPVGNMDISDLTICPDGETVIPQFGSGSHITSIVVFPRWWTI